VKDEARAVSFCFPEVFDRPARDFVRTVDPSVRLYGSDSPAFPANIELRERQRSLVKSEIDPTIDIGTT
jgi:hypothetical protein